MKRKMRIVFLVLVSTISIGSNANEIRNCETITECFQNIIEVDNKLVKENLVLREDTIKLQRELNDVLSKAPLLINKNLIISVPSKSPFSSETQINTIQDALNAISDYRIKSGATVTIQLNENVSNYDTININHIDGDKIKIVGNCGNNKDNVCTLQFRKTVDGVHIFNGSKLGYLGNLRLVGNEEFQAGDSKEYPYNCRSCSNTAGILVQNQGSLQQGENIIIEKFNNALVANVLSYIDAPSIICKNNVGNGISASNNSIIMAHGAKIHNNLFGVSISNNSTFIGNRASLSGNRYAIYMWGNSFASIQNSSMVCGCTEYSGDCYCGNIQFGSRIDLLGTIYDKSKFFEGCSKHIYPPCE